MDPDPLSFAAPVRTHSNLCLCLNADYDKYATLHWTGHPLAHSLSPHPSQANNPFFVGLPSGLVTPYYQRAFYCWLRWTVRLGPAEIPTITHGIRNIIAVARTVGWNTSGNRILKSLEMGANNNLNENMISLRLKLQ